MADPTTAPGWGEIPDDQFQQMLAEAGQELGAERDEQAPEEMQQRRDAQGIDLGPLDTFTDALGAGATQAIYETKDFLFGEPNYEDKSGIRKSNERLLDNIKRTSTFGSIVAGVSQFGLGLVGAGKLAAPLKLGQKVGVAGKVGLEVGKGAAVGAVVMDPHEERLSDLVQSFPALQNPVSEYLQADISDSAAEGRFKNALEGIGMDLALVGFFGASVRALKLFKSGDTEGATAAAKEAEEVHAANRTAEPPLDMVGSAQRSTGRRVADPLGPEARGDIPGSGTPDDPVELPEITVRPSRASDDGPMLTDEGLGSDSVSMGVARSEASAIPAGDVQVPVTRAAVPEQSVDDIVSGLQRDAEVMARYGSIEDATSAGYKFSAATRLPWQKLQVDDSRRLFVQDVADTFKREMDAAKGGDVLSDAKVRQMIDQRARLYNEDPATVVAMLQEAGANANAMAANMEAGWLVSNKMLADTYEVAFKIRNGMLKEWGGDADVAIEELRMRLGASVEVLSQSRAMTAAAGRSLRRMRGEFRVKPEQLADLQTLDGDKLVDLLYGTKGDPKKLAEMSRPSLARRALDEVSFSLVNSLLWLYPTHIVNMSTNVYMLLARPAEKALGSIFIDGLRAVRGQEAIGHVARRQAAKEYLYTATSLSEGWTSAVEAFKRGDSALTPHMEEAFTAGQASATSGRLPWKPVKSVEDLIHNAMVSINYRTIVGFPTRALGTMDEFIKTIRYRSVVQSRAAVDALEQGLEGDQLKSFMEQRLAAAFDENGRGVDPAAVREAQTVTFQTPLDYEAAFGQSFGKTTSIAVANTPPLRLVLPFVRTPINVFRYAWKMTPGLNMAQTEFRRAISGKYGQEAQAHAVGQMAIGTLFMGVAANLAVNGKLTGGGPADYRLKQQLMNSGWKPYSFVIDNEDGSKTYMPIGRFDPVGLPFGMIADLVDMQYLHPESREAEKGMSAVLVALAQNFSERTYLLNLNQAMEALSNPGDGRLAKYVGGLAGNAMPLSSLVRGLNPDPHLREARGVVDNAMKNLPGYSEKLPPKRDAFGDPMWRRIGLTSTRKDGVVDAEHSRMIEETGYGLFPPAPTRNGVDLREMTLENGRNAYDLLQEYAGKPPGQKSLKDVLAKLIESDSYKRLPDGEASTRGTRLWALSGPVSAYREGAFKRLLKESPMLREAVTKRQRDARAALTGKRDAAANPSPVDQLRAVLGI